MDKVTFLALSIAEQVEYYNKEMGQGKSFTAISKDIGISKSISEKFKHHGYKLEDGKLNFIGTEDKIINANKTKKKIPVEKKGNSKDTTTTAARESKTLVMDKDLWKRLKIYSIINDTTISEVVENLVRDFMKDKDI